MKLVIPMEVKISLNSRGATRGAMFAKARRIQTERRAVAVAFKSFQARQDLALLRRKNPSDQWTVTLTRVAPGILDDDNLAARLKAVRDEVSKVLDINDRDRKRLLFIPEQRSGQAHLVEIYIQTRTAWCVEEFTRLARLSKEAELAHLTAVGIRKAKEQ